VLGLVFRKTDHTKKPRPEQINQKQKQAEREHREKHDNRGLGNFIP
jgi:hypothetical protein